MGWILYNDDEILPLNHGRRPACGVRSEGFNHVHPQQSFSTVSGSDLCSTSQPLQSIPQKIHVLPHFFRHCLLLYSIRHEQNGFKIRIRFFIGRSFVSLRARYRVPRRGTGCPGIVGYIRNSLSTLRATLRATLRRIERVIFAFADKTIILCDTDKEKYHESF